MTTDRAVRNLSRFMEARFRQEMFEAELEKKAQMRPAITFSRETGAGATTIAHRVAELLQARATAEEHWAIFDRELITLVLEELHLPARLAKHLPEAKRSEMEEFGKVLLGLHPPTSTIVEKVNETIRRLVNGGNVILIGRGAHCVAKRSANAFHVRLMCQVEQRVNRAMDSYQVDAAEAGRLIERKDRERRDYVKHYFDRDIENPLDYHLIINTGFLSDEEVAILVADAALRHCSPD